MDRHAKYGGWLADLTFYSGLVAGSLVIGLIFYGLFQLGISQ
ncbi:MAG: hypothetical protein RJS97_23420 [Parvibaculaceae bacterium]